MVCPPAQRCGGARPDDGLSLADHEASASSRGDLGTGTRPLCDLLVMNEAHTLAPAGGFTTYTRSTLALSSQARKHGLGLVFATSPRTG